MLLLLGLMISGAISLAVNEVNSNGTLKDMGHSLDFKVAETYGEEVSSIRQTAALWTEKVYAYIGPQETCVHEGRMAAAFNLPMISYVSVVCLIALSNRVIYLLLLFVCIQCLIFIIKLYRLLLEALLISANPRKCYYHRMTNFLSHTVYLFQRQ